MKMIYLISGMTEDNPENDPEAVYIVLHGCPIEAWPSRELAEEAMALWMDSGVGRLELHEVELQEDGDEEASFITL